MWDHTYRRSSPTGCRPAWVPTSGSDRAGLLPRGTIDGIGHVGFLLFEHGQARGGFGHTLEHEPLDQGSLAPIVRVGFQHQFDARYVTHKTIGAQAHGSIFKGVVADLLRIGLGDYP